MAFRILARRVAIPALRQRGVRLAALAPRFISTSLPRRAGLMPDTENPQPRTPEPTHVVREPTPLADDAYHTLADEYLERVVAKMEEMAEGREDIDVEFSSGVLSITFPPNGTYVLNKQPPNKQIWLSSPVSGPKRYDWVVAGEDLQSKEGSGQGEWLYLRDGSTLTDLLSQELGISVIGAHD